ncbi:phage tail assembly protein [Pantoea septica]|uniref:phage tail assembly protein n=1 Tax=Pantoea septica TaxID=472695 RepID=UPI000EBCA928|nr:phage tail assembly protein [Pantoea septica]HAB74365.1 phage tail assembly protein [Pantoea sp.]
MTDKTTEKAVELDTPILRGKTEVTSVTVRKPQAGALRGIRLQALMDMDVNAMMAVLPRVTNPALTVQEINEMDPADLLTLSVEVITFLLPKSALSAFPTA